MVGNNNLLIFSCGVDEFSETQIVNAVNQTNYLVDNLVINILAADRMFASQAASQPLSEPGYKSEPILHTLLRTQRFHDGNANVFVVDILFRNMLTSILHTYFFNCPSLRLAWIPFASL